MKTKKAAEHTPKNCAACKAALAEYNRVQAPAWADYERVQAPALAEYRRVTDPALAEYERVVDEHRKEEGR